MSESMRGEIENYSLEEVWEKYGRRVPEGFQGHALSISDVIEFADGENSRFFLHRTIRV